MVASMRVFILLLCVCCAMAAPLNMEKDTKKSMEYLKEQLNKLKNLPGFDNEEYLRYWKEAVNNDPKLEQLRNLIHNNEKVDLESLVEHLPNLSDRLAKQSPDIRSRLEEAKRVNVEEMRQLQRLQMLREDHALKDGDWNNKLEGLRDKLPRTFNDKDIQDRIKKQRDMLENIDTERKVEFKRSEMAAEHQRREKLKVLEERKRIQAEDDYRKQQEKLRSHGKLHHPASEQQLEDVWEQQDGLDRDKFDPRTFFHLHDKNSDKHLDAIEWENLFYNELRKVYGDDMGGMEAREDLARMREHVITEMDKDKDGLVSLNEFIQYTGDPEFKQDEEWKSLVDEDPFSEEELEKYEDDYPDYYDYEYDEQGNMIGYKTKQKGGVKAEESPDQTPSNKQELPPRVHEEHAVNERKPPVPGNDTPPQEGVVNDGLPQDNL